MQPQQLMQPQALDDLFLYRIARLLATAGAPVIRLCEGEFGITRREWRLLALLAEQGGIASSALAERAQLDRARTSRAVTALAAKKLVQRSVRAGDARGVELGLTDAGRAVVAAVFPRVTAINQRLLSVLTPTEVQALAGVLTRLQQSADQLAQTREGPGADRRRGGRQRTRRS
ncbi:MAG: MarR family transcriptional regulator [Burkholderiaceae bacterium]|nr:MarR family transcriptional regulator [Burkholderiaceae bacterium]